MFTLHPTLAADTVEIGELPLCKALLLNDQRFPWVVLVPKRPNIREVFELTSTEQEQLWTETSETAKRLNTHYQADKMNVAALGNMVPQLHMHIIVRYEKDAAWPSPVWGSGAAQPYSEEALALQKETLAKLLLTL